MSMTPLQAIAAIQILESGTINVSTAEGILAKYRSNNISAALQATMMSPPPVAPPPVTPNAGPVGPVKVETPAEVAAALSQAWPEIMGFVPAGDSFFAFAPDTYNLADALLMHCNRVIGNGDICKFSQAVDRANSFISITNEMFDVIAKGKRLQLSDLGPGVTSHSQATNMGLVKLAETTTAAIKNTGAVVPTIPGIATNAATSVAMLITAQGSVAGNPTSPNFGTAVGMYEKAVEKGLVQDIANIHAALIETVGVPTQIPIPGVNSDYASVVFASNATTTEVNTRLAELESKALVDSTSNLIFSDKAQATRMINWVDAVREVGAGPFLSQIQSLASNALDNRTSPSVEILSNQQAMTTAINSLSRSDASSLLSNLGSTIQIDYLSKITDVLNFAKLSPALPSTVLIIPGALGANSALSANGVSAAPAMDYGVLYDKIPKVTGVDKGRILQNSNARPRQIIAPPFKPLAKAQVAILEKLAKYSGSDIAIRAQLGLPEMPASKMPADSAGLVDTLAESADAAIAAQENVADFIDTNTAPPPIELDSQTADKIIKTLSATPTVAALATALKQITGFGVSPTAMGDVSTVLKSIETPAGPTDKLDKLTEVIPSALEKKFKEDVGTGSAENEGYKLTDFFGSICGLNEQKTLWDNVMNALADIEKNHSSLLTTFASATSTAEKSSILSSAKLEYGSALTTAVTAAVTNFKSEWTALTTRAKVDYANLQAGDAVSAILLAKKLAQYATGVESGHAAIFQSVANATSLGGQAMIAVMTEARNTKLLMAAGLTPTSQTPKAQSPVTEADRDTAKAIQIATVGLVTTSVEQVAHNRMINNLPAPT